MQTEKITGWALLGCGLLICLTALLGAHGIFTGGAQPNQLMRMDAIVVTIPAQPPTFPGGTVEVMKAEAATHFISLMFAYILNVFVLLVGGKVAGIGVLMLREMKFVAKGG
jgi:hypothetical protein